MAFDSLASIERLCEERRMNFAQAVRFSEAQDRGTQESVQLKKMRALWISMLNASENYEADIMSSSGLCGGDGAKFSRYADVSETMCGSHAAEVIAEAIKMAESNACMKQIVACPTAGSCGVIPSVLIPLYKKGRVSEEKIVDALFVAAGIGQVIAERASIAGADGGCQAEIGSASAMAAGSLVFLGNGSTVQTVNAVGYALQNLMGLVCDPVGGLVEIPCVKRNVIGAMNALSCADMALAGLIPKIPADEVIDAMKAVGKKMDISLRETGTGGIAATPTAKAFKF